MFVSRLSSEGFRPLHGLNFSSWRVITCSSRESGDSSGETGLSRASREVVNVRCFSEKT